MLERLSSFETMTWAEIWKSGSHPIDLWRLCKDAQDRLTELKHDDQDSLISLRCGGKPRVWGIREHHIFHVLWWDPEHEVCPSLLKNT